MSVQELDSPTPVGPSQLQVFNNSRILPGVLHPGEEMQLPREKSYNWHKTSSVMKKNGNLLGIFQGLQRNPNKSSEPSLCGLQEMLWHCWDGECQDRTERKGICWAKLFLFREREVRAGSSEIPIVPKLCLEVWDCSHRGCWWTWAPLWRLCLVGSQYFGLEILPEVKSNFYPVDFPNFQP